MPNSTNPSTWAYVALVSQISLGIVFLVSAYFKVRQPKTFVRQVVAYNILPSQPAYIFGFILIPLETYVALSLLTGVTAELALLAAGFLLLIFLAAVVMNVWRGRAISCGCFGQTSEPISLRTIVRLVLLLLLAIIPIIGRYGANVTPIQPLSLIISVTGVVDLLQAMLFAALVIVIGMWLLSLPEMVSLIKHFYRSQASSSRSRS